MPIGFFRTGTDPALSHRAPSFLDGEKRGCKADQKNRRYFSRSQSETWFR